MGWRRDWRPVTTWTMVQVKADAASAQADAVVLRGRGGLEKYLVYAKGLVFWGEENVLELDRGDVCTTL